VIAVAGMRAAAGLVAPMFLAVVLAVAVLPIARWARGRGWPRWAALLLALGAAYGALIVMVGGIAWSIARLVATLPHYEPRAHQLTQRAVDTLSSWGVNASSAQTSLDKLDVASFTDLLRSVLTGVLGALAALFFLVVLLYFLVGDALTVVERRTALETQRRRAARVLSEFAHGTQRYLVVSALFGGIVAVLDSAALWLIGVPLALTWGLLSFLTNFVPNIGFVLGVIPPALLALLDAGWQRMVAVIVVYSALNIVIQTFIQPRYVGDAVGLNPTTTFLALGFWGYVLGPLGAFLAIPATLFVRALFIDGDPRNRWLLLLIGQRRGDAERRPGRPRPEPARGT
jgi:predicted PurR-regulated permease PerM